MPYRAIFDKLWDTGVSGAILLGLAFIFVPSKYPKISMFFVPIVSVIFILGSVPAWIIIGWTISGLVWFTIPIWGPLANGDAPFTKPD